MGLSLDGPMNVHDKNRLDVQGNGTFARIMKTVELFDRYQVDYNILSVVTGQNAQAIKRAYRLFARQGFGYLQFVVEGDGSVYPCDFYVFDKWKLGNVKDHSLEEMEESEPAQRFVEESIGIPKECKQCRHGSICRNGCRRDRVSANEPGVMKNYYCKSYYRFYEEREKQLKEVISILGNEKA